MICCKITLIIIEIEIQLICIIPIRGHCKIFYLLFSAYLTALYTARCNSKALQLLLFYEVAAV